jgi:integrase
VIRTVRPSGSVCGTAARARTNLPRCRPARVRKIAVHDARRTCATLLVDLDVHPRVVMQILRHAQFAITMEIYTQVSSAQTRAALKRLGDSLGTPDEVRS